MMHTYSGGDAMRRREEILRIVRDTPVHSQDELMAALRKRGFSVTQPTLSRDLRELGLVKTPNGYVSTETIAPVATFTPRASVEHRFEQLIRDSVISAEAEMTLSRMSCSKRCSTDARGVNVATGAIVSVETYPFGVFTSPSSRRSRESVGCVTENPRLRRAAISSSC